MNDERRELLKFVKCERILKPYAKDITLINFIKSTYIFLFFFSALKTRAEFYFSFLAHKTRLYTFVKL